MLRPARLSLLRPDPHHSLRTRPSLSSSLRLLYRRNRAYLRLLLILVLALFCLILFRAAPASQTPRLSVRVNVEYEYEESAGGGRAGAGAGGAADQRADEAEENVQWAMDHERANAHGRVDERAWRLGDDADPDTVPEYAAVAAEDARDQRERPRKGAKGRGKQPMPLPLPQGGGKKGPGRFLPPPPAPPGREPPRQPADAQVLPARPDRQAALMPPAPNFQQPPPKPMQQNAQQPYRQTTPGPLEPHSYLPNGLLAVNPAGRHPIYDLIARAEGEWKEKLGRQSKTLEQAVAEYKRRYGRNPPRGFDKWWKYVKRHNVQLPDEYDQILSDLEMFYSITPADLRRQQQETRSVPGTYTFVSSQRKGTVALSETNLARGDEEAVGLDRAGDMLELLHGFGETWVDEDTGETTGVEREIVRATGDWEATFTSHDVPREFANWHVYTERKFKAKKKEVIPVDKKPPTTAYAGWAAACAPDTPLRQSWPREPDLPLLPHTPKTFIYSHRESMNACVHPPLVHTSGFLLGHGDKGPQIQDYHRLLFGLCKTEGLHGDVLAVPTEGWTEDVDLDPEWEDKLDERMVWRGSNTGVLVSPEVRWEASQRIRFVDLMDRHNEAVNYPVLLPSALDAPVGPPEPRNQAWMNSLFADAAFTRGPIQCRQGGCDALWDWFEFRNPMTQAQQNQYKYIFDIDGNGWSARFKRLMSTRSLVLKATIFPEWYLDRVQPWVHYVPVQMDLSDLYDIMMFFRGDSVDGGKGGHDDLAKKIAYAGREWSLQFWRREDMVAYMWRLFLEYGRLVSDGREQMDFVL